MGERQDRTPAGRRGFAIRSVVYLASIALLAGCGASDDQISTDQIASVTPDEQAFADGMLAKCNKGGYSDNAKFSATCSSSGDVDQWLAKFGRCVDGRVIAMDEDASCDENDGFAALLRPGEAPTAGPDDVARCNDGTFSDNTDFSATCSSSGDVDGWLADYVECSDGEIIELNESTDCGGEFVRLVVDYTPPTSTTSTSTTTTSTTTSTTSTTTSTTTTVPPAIVPIADPAIGTPAPAPAPAPAPVPAPVPEPAPAPAPPAPSNVSYQNCDAVRAAGAAPIYRGDPGFRDKFDRDGDGVGCEN